MAIGCERSLRSFLVIGAAAALFCACDRGPDPGRASVAVKETFGSWKAAVLANHGRSAAERVTEGSLAQIGRYRELALHAPEAELDALSLIDRMFVLILRVQLSPDRVSQARPLAAMQPADVLAFLVEIDALGADYAGYSEIQSIAVDGKLATAQHTKFGRQIGAPLRFRYEGAAGWKLDLAPVIEQMGRDMDSYLASMEQKVAPVIYADAIVEAFTRRILEPRHLQPMVARLDGRPGS
jgi:hypothetical protein